MIGKDTNNLTVTKAFTLILSSLDSDSSSDGNANGMEGNKDQGNISEDSYLFYILFPFTAAPSIGYAKDFHSFQCSIFDSE